MSRPPRTEASSHCHGLWGVHPTFPQLPGGFSSLVQQSPHCTLSDHVAGQCHFGWTAKERKDITESL